MISVPLRGVIADGGYRNIIVLVISSVPLRGVTAKMNKSDRPETGRMYLFHNAGTIITHSAQKEKRNGEKNAAFPVRTAQEVRVKTMKF